MAYTPDPDDELDFGELSAALAEAADGADPGEPDAGVAEQAAPDTRFANMTLSPGVILEGRFRIEEFVDSGGMGQVYRATDTAIDATVALKLVRVSHRHRDDAARDERIKRVIREVTAARGASQRCGHILSIHDIRSLPSGDPYIVMEYLDGENLRDWIDLRAPVAWTVVRDIAVQLAAALRALHGPGFVHRDIKPANIFALEGDRTDDDAAPFLKLIDFGIVKDLDAASMTATAASLGTLRYMSPEGFSRTAKVTDRSDIFGVGLVLYEAISGVNPMPVEHNALVDLYAEGVPTIFEHLDDDVPVWLGEMIDRCLRLDPTVRPSAAELCAILNAAAMPQVPPREEPDPETLRAELRDALQVDATPSVPAADEPGRLAMPFEDTLPSYQLAQRPRARSSVPIAVAIFGGFCILAAAMLFMPEGRRSTAEPVAIASEPELDFRPTGPVGPEDFPTAPRTAAPQSVSEVAPISVTSVESAAAEVAPAPASAARRRKPARSRPPKRRNRTGLSKSFAEIRDSALQNAGATPKTRIPAATTYAGSVEYAGSGDDGAQFFNAPKPKSEPLALPVGSKLKAHLVSGISSSKHATVVARLTADIVVNGTVVLAKGDVIKGRSSNDSQRVFVDFRQGIRGGRRIKFAGHAVTGTLPGLPATKKVIPKEERGTNVMARGALTTAGSVAARMGGGVAGELAGDVAREGVTEARPDFGERQPFVLTVPEGVRFTVIVTGS